MKRYDLNKEGILSLSDGICKKTKSDMISLTSSLTFSNLLCNKELSTMINSLCELWDILRHFVSEMGSVFKKNIINTCNRLILSNDRCKIKFATKFSRKRFFIRGNSAVKKSHLKAMQ